MATRCPNIFKNDLLFLLCCNSWITRIKSAINFFALFCTFFFFNSSACFFRRLNPLVLLCECSSYGYCSSIILGFVWTGSENTRDKAGSSSRSVPQSFFSFFLQKYIVIETLLYAILINTCSTLYSQTLSSEMFPPLHLQCSNKPVRLWRYKSMLFTFIQFFWIACTSELHVTMCLSI